MKRKNPQLSATVDSEIYSEVESMAQREDRSLSEMTAILIRQAVKERKRKRNGPKTTTTE